MTVWEEVMLLHLEVAMLPVVEDELVTVVEGCVVVVVVVVVAKCRWWPPPVP